MGAPPLLGIILLTAAASAASGMKAASSGNPPGRSVGLVLVPVDQESARPEDVPFIRSHPTAKARERREVRDGHKKYQRLAHSVHVQSDIRYRSDRMTKLSKSPWQSFLRAGGSPAKSMDDNWPVVVVV